MSEETVCRAGPSLALIKYWGKSVKGDNLPATPSLAVTLGGVHTETRAALSGEDTVRVDGSVQDPARYSFFFDTLRHTLGITARFRAASVNTFPTSAGLASSSSGFAALSGACARAAGCDPSAADLSAIARAGSASAARSVFGGFVLLPAGARRARQVCGPEHWPDLRVVVAVTHRAPKPVPSRRAMEETRASSPTTSRGSRNPRSCFPKRCAPWKPATSSCWEKRRGAATASCTAPSSGRSLPSCTGCPQPWR